MEVLLNCGCFRVAFLPALAMPAVSAEHKLFILRGLLQDW
jgi:hypothetical protein